VRETEMWVATYLGTNRANQQSQNNMRNAAVIAGFEAMGMAKLKSRVNLE
jgi:hypothetical protein